MKATETIHSLEKKNLLLETQVKHLTNDLFLTKKEYEASINSYFDIYSKMEIKVRKRTIALEKAYEKLQNEINDRELVEAQLQQMDKMKAIGTLAGGIAHDFNNILAAIMGFTEIALMDSTAGSHLQQNLYQVIKASNRAKNLVRQILTFSRQSDHEIRPINIVPIVKESLKLFRALLPSTIEIQEMIQNPVQAIMADPTQIHQILMNLCTNAGHAMAEKGGILKLELNNIYLNTSDITQDHDLFPGPFVRLSVSDTGHGIDLQIIEKIFDPYFTTKKKGEGTGLGLSVVHGIVKSHGGSIKVKTDPGVGTTFYVLFPAIDFVETEKKEPPQPIPRGNEKILFIDDEKAVLEAGRKLLERLGYRVVPRTSSIEAFEAFRYQPEKFDLVITDHTMPNMTGMELAKKILDIRPEIPIILCTGFSETVTMGNVRSIGIRESLMKPIVMRDLAESIRKVLDGE